MASSFSFGFLGGDIDEIENDESNDERNASIAQTEQPNRTAPRSHALEDLVRNIDT